MLARKPVWRLNILVAKYPVKYIPPKAHRAGNKRTANSFSPNIYIKKAVIQY